MSSPSERPCFACGKPMTPKGGSILQCLACDVTEDGSLLQDIIPAKRLPHFSWWMPDGRISLVEYTDRNTLLP